MTWRALVANGTFLDVLPMHRAHMEAAGLEVVTIPWEPGGSLSGEQVHQRGQDVDVIFGPGPGLDAPLFRTATRLRAVSIAASGYEGVDLDAATAAGVVVTNAPAPAGSEAVADMAFGLILSVARQIPQCHHAVVAEAIADRRMGRGVWRKTLGIIGLGSIGRATARRASGFDMRVLVCNRSWTEEHRTFALRHGLQRVALDDLLRESDFVSLHLRGTGETAGFLAARELSLMKPSAYLINTARAGLVDEAALVSALVERRIAGAGLDTIIDNGFDSRLIGLANVVGTPHLGNRCVDSVHVVMEMAIDNGLAVLRGERCPYVVNPDVYRHVR